MSEIKYVTGDATRPEGDGVRFIAHVCNDVGAWGKGFVRALSRWDDTPERAYRKWHKTRSHQREGKRIPFALGRTQVVQYGPFNDSPMFVANMVAQRGIRHDASAPAVIDYEALRGCLDELGQEATSFWRMFGRIPSIHMPRIGCGLGGGEWSVVEESVLAIPVDIYGLTITVYDLPGSVA